MSDDLVARLRATTEWNDMPWWWDAPEKTFGGDDSPASLLAEAADQLDMVESIIRKIVRGDPQGQAYFDIEMGIIDAHADFTLEEQVYLREVQAEIEAADG